MSKANLNKKNQSLENRKITGTIQMINNIFHHNFPRFKNSCATHYL